MINKVSHNYGVGRLTVGDWKRKRLERGKMMLYHTAKNPRLASEETTITGEQTRTRNFFK